MNDSITTTLSPDSNFQIDQCKAANTVPFWGFAATLNILILIIQILITIFATYKCLCSADVMIALPLKVCMLAYHYGFLASTILYFIILGFWTFNDNINNPTSGSSTHVCVWTTLALLPPIIYIFAMTMFWFIRLRIVFDDSSLHVSTRTNKIMFGVIVGCGIIFLILVIALFLVKNNKCYGTYEVIGWLIDLTFTNGLKNNNNVDILYLCIVDYSHRETFIILAIFNTLAAVVVPLLNIVIAGLYIYKMYKLVSWQESSISHSSQELEFDTVERARLTTMKRKLIRRSGIIAIISVFSTLVSLFCWSVLGSIAVSLIMIDGLINGIALFAVCQFGDWIYLLFTCNDCVCFDKIRNNKLATTP